MNKIQKHFDKLGEKYDFWKKKNYYYYSNVKNIYKNFIPAGSKILDIGCGTGDILAFLNPRLGVGIDISSKLIHLAKIEYQNFKSLKFSTEKVSELKTKDFDFIILADVVEHLENVRKMFFDVAKIANPKTKIIITMANPSWEPILYITEKLRLKMPEGPHHRLSDQQLISIMVENHFKWVDFGSRLIIPINLGKFSDFINLNFYKLPIFKNWGVIHFFVFQKA